MESIDKQVSILMQGAEFGDAQIKEMMAQDLRQKLIDAEKEGRPLRVYCGYDVTAPDIHLGHMVILRKMRRFQDFGHQVTFLIGTFTTLIGDPSDRDEGRSIALEEAIKANAKTYADQALMILDPEKTEIRYNLEWLSKLTFADVISMASCFTVQQFLVRDRLRNRIDKNDPIWLRELLYPLAQGYDAVHLKADVQMGATEQLFNLMAGRRLQEAYGLKPQVCLTFPVLVGTDGTQRMSKSTGNYIGVSEAPEQIYGKVMSIADTLIMQYYELLTDVNEEELKEIGKQLDSGVNPMDLKKQLAKNIVTQLYTEKDADEAEAHFRKVVQNKELPDDIPEIKLSLSFEALPDYHQDEENMKENWYSENQFDLSLILVKAGLAKSRSEAIRLINQGAVSINGEKINSTKPVIDNTTFLIKVGKRRYAKIINTDKET